MRSASFPKDLRQKCRRDRTTMVRLQYMHPDGRGIEVVGGAPEWVVDKIDDILKEWAEVSLAIQNGAVQ
jgi:hypothetical protein